jgi:hypothetical protein
MGTQIPLPYTMLHGGAEKIKYVQYMFYEDTKFTTPCHATWPRNNRLKG